MPAKKKPPANLPAKRGRPPRITETVANNILDAVAGGQTLAKYCAKKSTPNIKTVRRYARNNEDFKVALKAARKEGAHALADDTIDIADRKSKDVPRDALRVRSRQWLAGKLNSQYSEKVVQEHTGSQTVSLVIESYQPKLVSTN